MIMKEPTKKITVRQSIDYNFNWVGKKVALDVFNDWCKENIPRGAKDVTLELMEDWEYDSCLTYLQLSWDLEVVNTNYEKEMKKWQKLQNKK
jgi:hypothetical protein